MTGPRSLTSAIIGDPQGSGLDHSRGHAAPLIAAPSTECGRSSLDDLGPATIVQLSSLYSNKVFFPPSGAFPRSVAFSSADPAAVSGPVVAAVAELLAQQTKASVGVLDAKLSSRSLHECFGIAATTGVADVGGRFVLAPFAQPVRHNLSVLCAASDSGLVNLASKSSRIQLAQFVASFDQRSGLAVIRIARSTYKFGSAGRRRDSPDGCRIDTTGHWPSRN